MLTQLIITSSWKSKKNVSGIRWCVLSRINEHCKIIFYNFFFFLQEVEGRTRNVIPLTSFLNRVVSDELYGFAKCDVRVPEALKEHFEQFPPIFKNTEVSIEDVGPYMKSLCQKLDYLRKPRRTLISSFFGKQLVLTTDQIKWYVQNGECFYCFFLLFEWKTLINKDCFPQVSL